MSPALAEGSAAGIATSAAAKRRAGTVRRAPRFCVDLGGMVFEPRRKQRATWACRFGPNVCRSGQLDGRAVVEFDVAVPDADARAVGVPPAQGREADRKPDGQGKVDARA